MKISTVAAFVFALILCGCGEVDEKDDNIDPNNEPSAVTVEVGRYIDGSYQDLEDGDPVEVISGFQGGWHLEPVLHVEGVEMSELTGEVFFSTETLDGEVLGSSGEQELQPAFFGDTADGWAYFSFPVIFDVQPTEYEGTEVVIIARGTVAGEPFEIEQRVMLVDEINETEGFG